MAEEELTNDEMNKESEASAKEFDEYFVCEGIFYSQSNGVSVEQTFGKVSIIGPEVEHVPKSEICKLKDMHGLHYEQSRVRKVENKADIVHTKGTEPLLTLQQIINKHTPVWLDTYENDRKGLRERLSEKTLLVDNQHLENTQLEAINYEKNTNLNYSSMDEVIVFYDTHSITTRSFRKLNVYDIKMTLRRVDYSNPNTYHNPELMIVLLDTTSTVSTTFGKIEMLNIDSFTINKLPIITLGAIAIVPPPPPPP